MVKVIKRPHVQAAMAAVAFAGRWEAQLARLAKKVSCQCDPPSVGGDESDHGPNCPVGLLLQAGRLMAEEADEQLENVRRW